MPVLENYDLAPFSAVDVSAGIEIQIMAGLPQMVRVEVSDETVLDRLRIEVLGGTLYVARRHGFIDFLTFAGGRVLVSVTAPEIDSVAASAGSDARLVGNNGRELELESSSGSSLRAESIDADRMRAAVSSGSKLIVAGKCGFAEFDSSSGSSLDAGKLDCTEVAVNSSSGSKISATAKDAARIEASSGSSIKLRGRPAKVDQHTDISSSISFG